MITVQTTNPPRTVSMYQGLWDEPPTVESFDSAALLLSTLERQKRGENDSRLRLHVANYTDAFGQIDLDTTGLTVELALGYAAFAQLCRILDLSTYIPFLRTLRASIVAPILQQYTGYLDPYEARLTIRARTVSMLGGTAHLYEVKRFWQKSATSVPTEHWAYSLTLMEQEGWQWLTPLRLQDDLLFALGVMPDGLLHFEVTGPDGATLPGQLGMVMLNSEAGMFMPRWMAVAIFSPTFWLPIWEPNITGALSQDLAALLDGSVGMFGLFPHFRNTGRVALLQALTAHSTVTITEVSAVELLMKGGLSKARSIATVGALAGTHLTNLQVIRAAIAEEVPQLNDDPLTTFNHVSKLTTTLW